MVDFGGWEMPLAYPTGTLKEHAACRESCAIFDVSHLGSVRLEGAGAFDLLQSTFTNDLGKIGPGRAQYTHLLDEDDASVLDDIIVWWVADEVFEVMPNASNTDRVVSAVGGRDVTDERAVLAVQGPGAREVVGEISAAAAEVPRFAVREIEIAAAPCVVAGTGYTGEDGVEIAVPRHSAESIWDALCRAGATPAGLGARDTLRLEAALPLHGHELGPGITSLQAGLGWVVDWKKPEFRGRAALAAERESGVARRLTGLSIEGRRPAREGSRVLTRAGSDIGVITSGNFSPTLGHCIALALVSETLSPGDNIEIDLRGSLVTATVCVTPFVGKKTSSGSA